MIQCFSFPSPFFSHHLNFSVNLRRNQIPHKFPSFIHMRPPCDCKCQLYQGQRISMPKQHMFHLWSIGVGYHCINGAQVNSSTRKVKTQRAILRHQKIYIPPKMTTKPPISPWARSSPNGMKGVVDLIDTCFYQSPSIRHG